MADQENGNKLLYGILASVLGLGGMQAAGTLTQAPPPDHSADVHAIKRVIDRTDEQGTPLVYGPRRIAEDSLKEQKRTNELLERLVDEMGD